MLILQMYSIFDQKADAFITPFFLPNNALAERAFSQSIQDPGHQFSRAPEDYTLFNLGEFHVTTGQLVPKEVAKTLGNGVLYINPTKDQGKQIDIEDTPDAPP